MGTALGTIHQQVMASCTAGTVPCNDATGVAVGPPLWAILVVMVVAVALVIGVVRVTTGIRRRRASR